MPRILRTETNRTYVTRMLPGEDIIRTIERIVSEEAIHSGELSLIGAVPLGAGLASVELLV